MPRLTPEKINEIRSSVDIVDVIGNYLPLERKGRNYMAVCPFHNDTHPSMSISPEKQIYKCFVCHHGGNVFTFLKDYLKISYIEAVKMVAEMGHVDIHEFDFPEKKVQVDKEKEPFYLMHEEANKIYRHYLNTKLAIGANDYLNDRQMTQDIIDYFEIGYAPDKNILLNAFEKLGYNKMQAFASGLVIESNQGYDRYHDRIMFPLHNSDGRIVGFSGRIYKQNNHESKYMNSPESKIFIKGETLYNYHRVKEAVREENAIIVLEGFMDVIALYKIGIKNAVAIMGTALTKGHLHLLRRYTKNIILCLDGDRAGKSAMMKCIDELIPAGFQVSVVAIPDNKDPDEYIKDKGKEEFIYLLKNPLSAVSFKMNYFYEDMNKDNYEDRRKYLQTMVEIIARIDDFVDRDYYVGQLENKSGFSKEIIYNLLNQQHHEEIPQHQEIQHISYKQTQKMVDKYQKAERDLLYYMMLDKKYAAMYEAKAGFMFDHINRIIASYIIDYYRQHQFMQIADLISSIDDDQIVQTIIDIASLNLPRESNNQAIEDYILMIKERAKIERKEELTRSLVETYDPKQKAQILAEIIALTEKE